MAPKKITKSRKLAKFMITYVCPDCGFDSGRTELDEAECFYCGKIGGLTEVKRVPMSKEAVFERIKISADRMVDNLRKAYGIAEKDWPQNPDEEMKLLEALASGQDLQKMIKKIGKKSKKK